jgi:hypothetical protein
MLMVTPTRRGTCRRGGQARPELLPAVGLYVASRRGYVFVALGIRWGYVWGYVAWRWVWLNAAAKSRVWRLKALPRSLPLGSQTCLVCVGRTHPSLGRQCQRSE